MIKSNSAYSEFDLSGHRLGNYRLVRLLGSGGSASVYMAEDLFLKRPVAIKLLKTLLNNEKDKLYFLEEARLLANLSHPHIIRVLEFSITNRWILIQGHRVEESTPFLVMDYAPGGNLRSLYSDRFALPRDLVINNIKQIASALQYAHDQHIIHRDIKPENFLMNERNEIVLSDFGLALHAPLPNFLSLQGLAGTLPYIAPEQLRGKPTFASDQYSLGIVAYEWLCGSLPFDGGDAEIMMHHISSPPPRLRHKNLAIQQPVEDVVLKALAKDPRQRHRSVLAFAQALEEANQPQKSFSPIGLLSPLSAHAPPANKLDFPTFHYLAQGTTPQQTGTEQTQQNSTVVQQTIGNKKRVRVAISSSTQRNRLRMIHKVRTFWIEGVLENSLRGGSFIPLGLEEKADAVDSRGSSSLQLRKQAQSFAPGTPITQVYDQAAGELLILGEAGSGKTTLLLELARHLLDRAEQNASDPIPVIFLLSSWTEKQLPLDQWLINELNNTYQVPRRLAELWLRNATILPLLDGLDEVTADARSACVIAINAYKQEQGLSSLVVSSRLTDYLLFPPRVILQTAVVIRPLTLQQSEKYLRDAGKKFEVISQILHEDLVMRLLINTPLMLNIVIVAYQDASIDELLLLRTPAMRYQQILRTYVEQMLHRHTSTVPYSPEQCINQLTYLARQMQRQNNRIFYIEQIQPKWIDKGKWLHLYMWLAVLLPGALIGAIMITLASNLFFNAGTFIPLADMGAYGALMGYMYSGKRKETQFSKTQSTVHGRAKKPVRQILGTALFLGISSYLSFELLSAAKIGGLVNAIMVIIVSIIVSLLRQKHIQREYAEKAYGKSNRKLPLLEHAKTATLVGFAFGANTVLRRIFNFGLFNRNLLILSVSGLRDGLRDSLVGFLISVLMERNDGTIHRSEIVAWSWKRFARGMSNPLNYLRGVLVGNAIGLGYGITLGLQNGLNSFISMWLSPALLISVGYILVTSILAGISSQNLNDSHRKRPNEGIRRSLYHGLLGGVLGTLLTAFTYLVSNAIHFALTGALQVGKKGLTWSSVAFSTGFLQGLHVNIQYILVVGLFGGLLAALLLGWLACLQHYLLRLVLRFTTPLPLNLADSLEYMVRCAFLHKVGGGYMFIHRLLLEHFASQSDRNVPANVTDEGSSSYEREPLVKLL